jgi:hypothetical protein
MAMTTDKPSYTQLVGRILQDAQEPLTVDEILARAEAIRPVETRNPASTVRNAIGNDRRIVTLGGRPARYTWWPHHLADNTFRQPLRASDQAAGTMVLTAEVRMAMRPDFFRGPSRSEGQVTLCLEGGPTLETHVSHLVAGQAKWGFGGEPVLAEWLEGLRAVPGDDLIVRVLDVENRRYALSLDRRGELEAILARNRVLADAAEAIVRAGRGTMPDFDLLPRLIARDAYQNPLPPDPWNEVLRADLRFVIGRHESANLASKVVSGFEKDADVPPDPMGRPKPPGKVPWRAKGVEEYTKEHRRAWAEYLFDRGMDHLWVG